MRFINYENYAESRAIAQQLSFTAYCPKCATETVDLVLKSETGLSAKLKLHIFHQYLSERQHDGHKQQATCFLLKVKEMNLTNKNESICIELIITA